MIVAGFGFRSGAGAESLRAALQQARGGVMPARLATAAGKEAHAALQMLADEMGLGIVAISPESLKTQETLTQSCASNAAYGTGSVAEAAALAAAGTGARLRAPRQISPDRMASCAIAEGDGQ